MLTYVTNEILSTSSKFDFVNYETLQYTYYCAGQKLSRMHLQLQVITPDEWQSRTHVLNNRRVRIKTRKKQVYSIANCTKFHQIPSDT